MINMNDYIDTKINQTYRFRYPLLMVHEKTMEVERPILSHPVKDSV
jgi:hypothetical protein